MSDALAALFAKLDAAGFAVAEDETRAGESTRSVRVAARDETPSRARIRAIALSLGLKARRLEFEPLTPETQTLIAFDEERGRLLAVEISTRAETARATDPRRNGALSAGGFSIALSGGDGAGKSTAIAMLGDWLCPEIDVLRLHFGRPQALASSSLLYRSFGVLRRSGIDVPLPMIASEGGARRLGVLAKLALALQLLCLARDRNRMHRRMRIAVGSGRLVICDRYPDARISDMDGPRLDQLWDSPGRLQSRLIAFERRCYSVFTAPDLHIVLRVSPDVAARRQPEDDPTSLKKRVEAVLRTCEDPPEDVSRRGCRRASRGGPQTTPKTRLGFDLALPFTRSRLTVFSGARALPPPEPAAVAHGSSVGRLDRSGRDATLREECARTHFANPHRAKHRPIAHSRPPSSPLRAHEAARARADCWASSQVPGDRHEKARSPRSGPDPRRRPAPCGAGAPIGASRKVVLWSPPPCEASTRSISLMTRGRPNLPRSRGSGATRRPSTCLIGSPVTRS